MDDVLNLKIDDLLSRRLQTIVQKNMLLKTPYQARQMIVHRHVMIGDRIINIPSYRVKIEEEDKITLDPNIKDKLPKTQDKEIKTQEGKTTLDPNIKDKLPKTQDNK